MWYLESTSESEVKAILRAAAAAAAASASHPLCGALQKALGTHDMIHYVGS